MSSRSMISTIWLSLHQVYPTVAVRATEHPVGRIPLALQVTAPFHALDHAETHESSTIPNRPKAQES